jgi:hypothetical protein
LEKRGYGVWKKEVDVATDYKISVGILKLRESLDRPRKTKSSIY